MPPNSHFIPTTLVVDPRGSRTVQPHECEHCGLTYPWAWLGLAGTPLPKWFRTVAEVTAFIYLILAIISIVENNVFDGLFFGSITSTGLSMQLALRGASPPTLPGNFCGGRGPNQLPAAWFIAGVVWLAVTNTAAWSVRLDLHLKVYAISFLLWAAFDLFLLIVMQEFKVFGLDAIVVLTLFIFNIFFQYEGYKQDEETCVESFLPALA